MYLSIQNMLSQTFGFIPRLAYCSVWIFHYLQKRDRITKELINVNPVKSREEIMQFFTAIRLRWEASGERKQLEELISAGDLPQVNKIVAFACGRMSFYAQEPWALRSAYQHVLILTIRDILCKRQGNASKIECFAQVPIYNDVDRKVLEHSGIQVHDDPQGFLETDESTVVLSFGANIPVRQIALDIARPAMMIWDRIESVGNELERPVS
jgi:hypothetical protein